MIISSAFTQAASRAGGQPAVIDQGNSVSYAELRERIGRLSNYYQAELPHGAKVGLLARNGAAFAQSLFAVSNSGNPAVLLDAKETDENLASEIRALQVHALLVTGDQMARAQELQRRERLELKLFEIEKRRAGEYDSSFQPLPDRPIKDTDPVLYVRHDDGGNDRRYCVFTHTQLIAAANSVKRFYKVLPSDRFLTTMRWTHPFALAHGMLLPMFNGASCVIDPDTESVEEFVDFLASQRVTRFVGPPKFYFQLLNFCAARKYPLPGVKSITVGMGSLSLALRKTYKLLKIPVLRCYGRTEALWSLAMDDIEEALDIEGARSRPVQGVKMQVVNEEGEEIPGPGRREGRLLVTSDYLVRGYYQPGKKREDTKGAENFRGTWLRTDDVARLEGDNDELRVAVLGKTYDMLCSEGVYHSPRQIDAAVQKIAGVQEGAGFVRTAKDGSTAFAVALVMAAAKVNEKDLLAQLAEELPDEFVPRTVHFVSFLPRDAFDSVNRLALSRQFSAV